MPRWGQELHVVNVREAPVFSMDNSIPVSLDYGLSRYVSGLVASSAQPLQPILVSHVTRYCATTKKLFSLCKAN